MKKKLLIALACFGALVGGAALFSYAPAPGSTQGVGGTYYVNSDVFPVFYGKLDTFGSSATDTLKVPVSSSPKSITYSNNIFKVAGTPTVTVALYASADGGNTYGTTAVTTYTVSPTSLTVPICNTYLVNNTTGGNPFTNYMWVATNSASATCSWKGNVLVR